MPTLGPAYQIPKPMVGARPITGHPLRPTLAFLFNELAGIRAYAVQSPVFGTLTNNATFGTIAGSPRLGMQIPSVSGGRLDVVHPDDSPFLGATTLVWKGYFASSVSGFQHLAGKHTGNGNTQNPFDFRIATALNSIEVVRGNTSSGGWGSTPTFTSVAGQYVMAAVAMPPLIEQTPTFMLNGRLLGAGFGGGTSGAPTGSNANIRIGQRADGGTVQFDEGSIELVYFYNRRLSIGELQSLYRNPYQWLDYPLSHLSRSRVVIAVTPGTIPRYSSQWGSGNLS